MYLRSLVIMLLVAGAAFAQSPQPQQQYLGNFYNRQTQPLSPYLNLARGGNPVVNYFYGVRPGLPSGGANNFGQYPQIQPNVGPLAGGFLPQSQIPVDAPPQQQYEPGGVPIRLASPAHPVIYGNQFAGHGSFSSVYASNVNRTGFAPSGQVRSVASGLGTINSQSRTGGGFGQSSTRRPPSITALP